LIYLLLEVINNMKVAVYCRVSTKRQAEDGFSLDYQLDRIKSYCKAKDWLIYDVFIDDGFSAKTINRNAYRRMMDFIDDWDAVIVLKIDRIHRNSSNFFDMMNIISKNGKDFISIDDSFDTSSAIGRFTLDIIERLAQLESEQIGERVLCGQEEKVKEGNFHIGRSPFGYRWDDNDVLERVDTEFNVVSEIFLSYLDGESTHYIADKLNVLGVKTACNGRRWESQRVSQILKNPVYCGFYHWNGYIKRGSFERVVDIDEFLKVQDIFQEHGGKPYLFN